LHPGFRRSLEGAYQSLVAGGLGVGAALTDTDERILAAGRNRAYDPPGGDDILQGNPLAHAEMNVLARVRTGQDLATATLWSTQQPCGMCTATAEFTRVGTVRYLARDPWAIASNQPSGRDTARFIGPADGIWLVVANVFFLLSIASSRGLEHPTVAGNRVLEPETTAVIIELVAGGQPAHTLTRGRSMSVMLTELWDRLVAASQRRVSRLAPKP
jgi:tRNA(Arg) A34 adenosine deaminase TadA